MKNKLLIPVFFCLQTFAGAGYSFAQQKPDMDFVKQQMAKAQKMLDSVRKVHPEIPGNVKMPAMPDMDKLNKTISDNKNKVEKFQQQTKQNIDEGLPESNAGKSFTAIPDADNDAIVAIAKAMLKTSIDSLNKINPYYTQALDTLLLDTSITAAGRGMLMIGEGYSKFASKYLICKGIIQSQYNPWAINDLGIFLRNDNRYPEAIQCFKYAFSFNDTFQLIKCNLAWATAYYGDFINAKKMFNEIVQRLPKFNLGWEGLGMIAYKEGDLATLWKCMTAQLKTFSGGDNSGPSDAFTSLCGGVMQDEELKNMGGQSSTKNPMEDETFNNNNGEDENNQDPPPTADSETPTYNESLGGMFAQNIDQMQPLNFKLKSFYDIIKQKMAAAQSKVTAAQKGLSKLEPPSYITDQGETITPHSFKKLYSLFYMVEKQYAKRVSFINKEFDEEWKKLENSLKAQNIAFNENYAKAMQKCGTYPQEKDRIECERQTKCEFKARAKGLLGQNLMGISQLWSFYFDHITQNADWYVSATTPFIKRMVKQDWNTYLNDVREYDIRNAILGFYAKWLPMQGLATDGTAVILKDIEVLCRSEIREIPANGPDPKNVKLKKLHTAAPYCDRKAPGTSIDAEVFSYEDNCDHTRFVLKVPHPFKFSSEAGAGPVKGGVKVGIDVGLALEEVKDPKFSDKNYYKAGLVIGVGAEASGGFKAGNAASSFGAEGKLGASASIEFGCRYNQDLSKQGNYSSVSLSEGVSGKENLGGFGGIKGELSSTSEYKREVYSGQGSNYKVMSDGVTNTIKKGLQ